MEVLAFLHHSLAYEHPDQYELQLDWDDLKTIPSVVMPAKEWSEAAFSYPLATQTAGYLLCLLSGLAVLAASEAVNANTLAHGSYGHDVQQLQIALRQAGYFHGPVTGFYGSITHQAVMDFQHDHALAVDGIAGRETLGALYRMSAPVGGGNLTYGMYGADVLDLQYRLSNAGYFSGPFTGYFGEMTEASVMALQRDFGLQVDGIVGPSTRAALSGAIAPQVAAPLANTGSSQSLRFGSVGPAVTQLQRDLATAGFYSGPFTEYFGEMTEAAVIRLQAAYGLAQDGIAGPQTQTAIAQALAGSAPQIAAAPEPPAQPAPSPEATPTPDAIATAEPTPEQTPSPSPTTATPPPESPPPESTDTPVSEASPSEEGPLPVGFIELQTDLQAYDSPNGSIIESGYPLNAGQILGYAEDQGNGWIRIVGAGNGDDAWIFAGENYENVEIRTSSEPAASPTDSPNASVEPSPQPDSTNTVVLPSAVESPAFFVGPTSVELEQSLTAYDSPNGTAQNITLEPGERLSYVAATRDCWVLVKDSAGQSSWVFAGDGYGSLKFLNDAFPGVEVKPPSCTAPAN